MNNLINILIIIFINFSVIHKTSVNGQLSTRLITVNANSTQQILVYDDNENRAQDGISFFTIGLHSQKHNLTLIYRNQTNNESISGHNIGLVLMTDTESGVVFINNENTIDLNALVTITGYRSTDPIPGACNEEFPLEISPFLRLYDNSYVNRLEFQHSNIGTPKGFKPINCDESQYLIDYEIYSYFLSENDFSEDEYFRAITIMSNISTIESSATRLSNNLTSTRAYFFSYTGRGIVYNIIASSQKFRSAYIPVLTYDCDDLNDCNKQSLTAYIVSVILGVFGFVVCLRGHYWFQTQVLLIGFIDGAFIAYVLLLKYWAIGEMETALYTLSFGGIVAIIWLAVWKIIHIPLISLTLSGLSLGLLIISTILFTNIGNLDLFHNDMNYWLIIGCSMILITLFFIMVNAVVLSIISSSIVGSYLSVIAVNRFIDGSLSYIILNVIRRAIINYSAINTVPFQNKDIVLSILWILLSLLGIVLQLMNNSPERSPFPAPTSCSHPHRQRTDRHPDYSDREESLNDILETNPRRLRRSRRFNPWPTAPTHAVTDERTHLLYNNYNINAINRSPVNGDNSPPPDYDFATNTNQREYQTM